MTTQEIIDYYKGLLILQYASLPNALGTIEAYISALLQNQIISQVRDAFDVDTAIGAQLDILATYRGLSRVVFGIVPGNFWSLIPYDDPDPNSYFGWAEYPDPDPTWGWIQYGDIAGAAYRLTDAQLRGLIKFKAQTDSQPLFLGNLDQILYDFFGVYVTVIDNEDMTMIYQHQIADPDINQLFEMAVLAGILPHPAGVLATVVEV